MFVCKWQIVDYHSPHLLLSRGKCSEADRERALHFIKVKILSFDHLCMCSAWEAFYERKELFCLKFSSNILSANSESKNILC